MLIRVVRDTEGWGDEAGALERVCTETAAGATISPGSGRAEVSTLAD